MDTSNLTPEQVQDYKHVFNLFDIDNSGAININELGSAMKSLGMKPTEEELERLMNEVDKDGTGEIEFDEFIQLVGKKVNDAELMDQLERVFHKFDCDNDAFLDCHDLVYALKTFAGTHMTAEEAREVCVEIYFTFEFEDEI